MNNNKLINRHNAKYFAITLIVLVFGFGCHKPDVTNQNLKDFTQVNLVANTSEYHPLTIDTTLINAFGIAWSPNGIAWVNSVGGHVSELYTAEGVIARHPVTIPSPTDSTTGLPCGVVFSGGLGFNLSNGPSQFLFSGFDGVLSGWNGASGNFAKRLKAPARASFTGLATASANGHNFIYAANFGDKKINVWDTSFAPVTMSFKDPTLPANFSPYNIQAVGDFLFVMYAELSTSGPTAGHGVAGSGKGFVSVFLPDGSFVKRFASNGTLNVPWGVTAAPASFLDDNNVEKVPDNNEEVASKPGTGKNNDLKNPVILVGNFGDGRINVFNVDGKFIGQLKSHNKTLVIDGLWALSFPPASANIDPARLYFTAGPDSESDGVFGYLKKQ